MNLVLYYMNGPVVGWYGVYTGANQLKKDLNYIFFHM